MTTITKKLLLFLVLTAASYLLNTVHLSLYYGVHFLFGSIPLVMLLKKLGAWPAFIGAIIAQSYTLFLWNHPYALIIFSLEILFLGFFFTRKLKNIILRDALYWLLLGIPLVFLFYGEFLQFGLEATMMVALKDMMNGLVNVWGAVFLLFVFSLLSTLWKKEVKSYYTMHEILSYLSSGVLLVLSFTLVMLIGYYEQDKGRSQLSITAEERMSEAERYYDAWVRDKVLEHQYWMGQLRNQDVDTIQSQIRQLSINGTATDIELQTSTIQDTNSMEYRIEQDEPYLIIHSPLDIGQAKSMSVETKFSIENVESYVLSPVSTNEVDISMVNKEGILLFSNLPDVKVGGRFQGEGSSKVLERMQDGNVVVKESELPAMLQWKRSTYTVVSDPQPDTGVSFVVATSFRPFIDYRLMNEALLVILFVLIVTLVIGELISDRLLFKFESLSRVTTEVVEDLPEIKKEKDFPRSMIYEFETLSHNFQILIKEWQDKYSASQKVNEELQQKKVLLEQSQEKMEYMAHYDDLTKLPNRRHFNKKMDQLIVEGDRFGLLFIDLDRFKTINDEYGHDVGDKVLIEVARRLSNAVQERRCFRLSGDEFTVLITPLEEDLKLVLQRILKQFETPLLIEGHSIDIALSIGHAVYPDHETTKNNLIKRADDTMYECKNRGRNELSW
ncbi:GGDEF domain-containing protein [Halobacillus salinus]|uniref:GGDEF domain-containing protein n=1 Tax=Halobacillus salinus TaxID=192814 RepID=A0A4Z0GYD5_9BACI|nr:GGDEF domain-containing protein [Halobacillus salinus]TGB02231.1 GGDEF domain-containing protein [Halobacillus salinus]